MFLKMQNFAASDSLRISTTGKEKKCKQNFTKNLDFLALLYVIRISKGTCEVCQLMTKMYTPSVPRDNLPKKSTCSSFNAKSGLKH